MSNGTNQRNIDIGTAVKYGIYGGLIAGVIFAIFEMAAAAVMGMSALAPLQMIGAIALGPEVLPPAEATVATVIVAMGVHLLLSAIYGVVLALVVMVLPALRASLLVLVAVGALYGFALWLVNFYAIAPFAFPWFAMADPAVQFIAHTVFFGAALGYYLGTQIARRPATI